MSYDFSSCAGICKNHQEFKIIVIVQIVKNCQLPGFQIDKIDQILQIVQIDKIFKNVNIAKNYINAEFIKKYKKN